MSRSYKKPFASFVGHAAGSQKKWRVEVQKALRKSDRDIPSGNYYKKINDVWWSPMDGGPRYMGEETKYKRK